MATAILTPIIVSMHGRFGDSVYYHFRGKTRIRSHVLQRNPDTGSQRLVRKTFADAVKAWQAMTGDERYGFDRKARHMRMSGYNLFISRYMTERISRTKAPVRGLPEPRVNLSAVPVRTTSVSYSITKETQERTAAGALPGPPGRHFTRFLFI